MFFSTFSFSGPEEVSVFFALLALKAGVCNFFILENQDVTQKKMSGMDIAMF